MQVEYLMGLLFFILIGLQILEGAIPWATYCDFEFSLTVAFSPDLGLSFKHSSPMPYNYFQDSLCGPFKNVIENGCADFCENLSDFSRAGAIMFAANLLTIFLNGFIGLLFICKANKIFYGAIAPRVIWVSIILKIIAGIAYMEIIRPWEIKNCWKPEMNFFFNIGTAIYAFEILYGILVGYVAYNLPEGVLGKSKLTY